MSNVKITNLERSRSSQNSDLLVIVQNDVTKTISKNDFVRSIVHDLGSLTSKIQSVQNLVQKTTIKKTSPVFNTQVSAKNPEMDSHLATKFYVDSNLAGAVRDVKGSEVSNILRYSSRLDQSLSSAFDIVHKHYVDTELAKTLKVLQEHSDSSFPVASEGDTFLFTENHEDFSNTGIEVTSGDIMICINTSNGGENAGSDFIILNTNIGVATEESVGLVKLATDEEIANYSGFSSAVTPPILKLDKETSSAYNYTLVDAVSTTLLESNKGIIGVNTATSATTITLPLISLLAYPRFTKYTIKDESNNASRNNITIATTNPDTIDDNNSSSIVINSNKGSIELYTNGEGKWFTVGGSTSISTTSTSSSSVSTASSSYAFAYAGEVGNSGTTLNTIKEATVDLTDLNFHEGVRVYASGEMAANANTKRIYIYWDGNITNITNRVIQAPNGLNWMLEAYIMKSEVEDTASVSSRILFQGANPELYSASSNTDYDWQTASGTVIALKVQGGDNNDILTNTFLIEKILYR